MKKKTKFFFGKLKEIFHILKAIYNPTQLLEKHTYSIYKPLLQQH